ncbi:MAG: cytochrome D ubiquinol oxidase subunit II, partial [Cyanobacteria bacterium]|nr:cytochrome D ubiquinol oxidase subunit II [Cyanobacteriota bacterium]
MGLRDRKEMANQFPRKASFDLSPQQHGQSVNSQATNSAGPEATRRSEDERLVNENLSRILQSSSYQLAHADEG